MNMPNNKRKKESQKKIEKIFIELIQNKEINEISVTEIVKLAKINRSTFYANYIDIYDLADKLKEKLCNDYVELYKEEHTNHKHSYNYLPMFQDIKNNQLFYKTLFKLNFDFRDYYKNNSEIEESIKYHGTAKNIEYHIEFFKAGMTAIIKKWLDNGCKESPEEMVQILKDEYRGKNLNI